MPDDKGDTADTDDTAELVLMPTAELQQLLDPVASKSQGVDEAKVQVDRDVDVDDGAGFDPYNRG